MKKLIMALICGLMLVPITAWGQKWIEQYTTRDGTRVEGHWQTREDVRNEQYSTPGKINPYTGQFTPYTNSLKGPQPVNPTPMNPNPLGPQNYQRDYRYRDR